MATLSRIAVGRDGACITPAVLVFTACTVTGDECLNDSSTFFYFKNTNAAARTVTFTAQKTSFHKEQLDDIPVANATIVIALTVGEGIIRLPPAFYNDANGKVQLTYSAVTNLSVAALRLVDL